MDADNFRSKMNSVAYGTVMAKAAEDYKQEMLSQEAAARQRSTQDLNLEDLRGDTDLEKLHRDRLAELQREVEKRQVKQRRGHGEYQEVKEADFLDTVTQTQQVVCHFWHSDFMRCKIMDKHLQQLAPQHFDTRFIKVSAAEAPFFTEKLNVRVLPCVIAFINGVAVERLVGFDAFGNRDDFKTGELLQWLVQAGGVAPQVRLQTGPPEHLRTAVRTSRLNRRESDDESSDFSD
jgi:thiol-disulfide isomerase/thioredoxin